MFHRGFYGFDRFCSGFFYSPWHIVIAALVAVAVAVTVFLVYKAAKKRKFSGSSEALELLKTKFVTGEISQEEYEKKKEVLKN